MQVGVLGRGVITPDRHLADVVYRSPGFLGELGFSPIMVEPCHGGELSGVDIGGVALGDQGVGIGGVADH